MLWENIWKKMKLVKMSNFTFSHNVFYATCILKSFNGHISVVICSFFEFGTVSKWCIREWVNMLSISHKFLERSILKTLLEKKKMLVNSMYSFSNNVSYLEQEKLHHLSHLQDIVSKCFKIYKRLKFYHLFTLSQKSSGFYVSAIKVF